MPSYRCVECGSEWTSSPDVAPACPKSCLTQPQELAELPTAVVQDPLADPTPAPVVPPHRCCGR